MIGLVQYSYPFKVDGIGRTARIDNDDEHVKQLLEQTLFTEIGERVNRPSFGTNVSQLLFAPNSEELATSTSFMIQASLQQWLGDLIDVRSVAAKSQESTLTITITYNRKGISQVQNVDFKRPIF